jgi:hypothetical protein
MKSLLYILFGVTAVLGVPRMASADSAEAVKALATAQAAKDLPGVEAAVKLGLTALGDKAGVPEEASEFVEPDENVRPLAADQVPELFNQPLAYIREHAWWKQVRQGAECQAPLRAVASVVEGCLAARKAGCEHGEELLAEAKAAADFLVFAQKAGGRDNFPFPGWRGKRGKLGALAEKFLSKAEAAGKVDDVLQDGWIIDDLKAGDLLFDNGLAGVALLAMYEVTKEEVYLNSARKAGDWAITRPCVPNWNYNSFSVHLLANLHRVTGDAKYLEAAKEKCRLGILPGQLKEGPLAGRWADPHNAKLVYHFIILRGLISLLAELPDADADRAAITQALTVGLKVRNAEIISQGGSSPDTTLEVYCRLLSDRAHFGDIITKTDTESAAKMIFRTAVEEFKNEHPTVSPGSWGRYLLLTASRGK